MNDIRQKILEVSKLLYEKGMLGAYEGNVSVRDGDKVYITPTGQCKGYLTENMIVVTDIDGKKLEGELEPSSEIKLHLAVYKLRPDVKSVIHDHSVFATAYAMANKPIETKALPEMIIDYTMIPVVKYGTPSTNEIHEGIKDYVFDTNAFLLANHGLVAYGNDVYQAFFRIESVENMAKTLTIAKLLGGEKAIPDEKLDVLYAMHKAKFGTGKIVQGPL
jgi:L-fuculose-phosphate aldolase